MCTYCTTTNYRRIYENHNGLIPKDSDGRTYEIHHLDGNHNNNHPTNLIAVTIQEHYEIHYNQRDWNACKMIKLRMDFTIDEIRELGRKGSIGKVSAMDQLGNTIKVPVGDPRLASGELSGVTKGFTPAIDKNGNSFHVSVNDPRYLSGKLFHHNYGTIPPWHGKKKICEKCKGIFDYGNYTRYHGDKCNVEFRIKPKFERITNSRKVIIDEVVYKSLSEASDKLGIKIATIFSRIASPNFIGYQYWSDDK
jgi:hypothetical protein